MSKLYIPGACASTRTNNFGFSTLNPKNLNCDTVDDYSEETCNLVMTKGARHVPTLLPICPLPPPLSSPLLRVVMQLFLNPI